VDRGVHRHGHPRTFAGAFGHRSIDLCDGAIVREDVSPSEPEIRLVRRTD
jgi:hypothetical protein